jgi:hypothetical protein
VAANVFHRALALSNRAPLEPGRAVGRTCKRWRGATGPSGRPLAARRLEVSPRPGRRGQSSQDLTAGGRGNQARRAGRCTGDRQT